MMYLVARMTTTHRKAITATTRMRTRRMRTRILHRGIPPGIVVIASMILTPFLCPKLRQMTSIIFSTGLGSKSFAEYASKFSYVLSSSKSTANNIILRKSKEADPSKWLSSTKYEFSQKTSTTSLRPHIEKYHIKLFKALAEEKGWKILLPGLVSQARSQATNKAANSQHERADNFDEHTFHQYLLNFIVADNQVCSHLIFLYLQCSCLRVPTLKSLNLVECREFRLLLLLLRNDLKEEMIPHRTKLRDLIIRAWKQFFQVLRRDLAVCDSQPVSCVFLFS
jgi:hypothetical protein